jgi:hypothetical protein
MILRFPTPPLIAALALAIAATSIVMAADSNDRRTVGTEQLTSNRLTGGWRFVRTPNPRGGADALSIMHTADTSRSDPDLAGLMIRCRDGGIEVVIIFIRSFPFRAQPIVFLGPQGHEAQFKATIVPPGTAILLPTAAADLVRGSWHGLSDLFIRTTEGQKTIRGVVPLAGLQAALKVFIASCPIP